MTDLRPSSFHQQATFEQKNKTQQQQTKKHPHTHTNQKWARAQLVAGALGLGPGIPRGQQQYNIHLNS